MSQMMLYPHPLTSDGRVVKQVKAGTSIEDLVCEFFEPGDNYIVAIDGVVVPQDKWAQLAVWDEQTVHVRKALADGPGANIARAVLSLTALAATQAFVPGSAAFGTRLIAGLVQGGIIYGIHRLIPPYIPDEDKDEQRRNFTLSGGANRARPNEPVMLVLGTHRVFPDLAGLEYTEFSGVTQRRVVASKPAIFAGKLAAPEAEGPPVVNNVDDNRREEEPTIYYSSTGSKRENQQYLNQVFDFGIGNLQIENYRLGETLLSDLDDSSDTDDLITQDKSWNNPHLGTNGRAANPASGTISLVDGNVDTLPGGDLEYGTPIQRTTAANIRKITWHIQSQNFTTDDEGKIKGGQNSFALEYKLTTASQWTRVHLGTAKVITMPSPSNQDARTAMRRSVQIIVPSGKYDVRIELVTKWNTTDTRLQASASLFAITAHQPQEANWTDRNPLALRVRATGKIYGTLESLNADVSQLIDTWDGSAWQSNQVSSNPAYILRKFWKGWYRGSRLIAGRGLADSAIDDEALKSWGAFCDTNNLKCDLVLTERVTDREVENMIARCGWGSVVQNGGKRSVIWENDDQPVTYLYTPSNIVAGSMAVEYQNQGLADEIVGTFFDADQGYETNTIRRSVGTVGNPNRPATVDLTGIVRGQHAAKEINRMVAAQTYHGRSISWEVGADGTPLFVSRGDVVGLGHGLVGGSIGGRLASINDTRDEVTAHVDVPAAGTLWVTDLNGDLVVRTYTASGTGGAGETLTLASALPGTPAGIDDDVSAYTFMAFDASATPRKVRISGIEHVGQSQYRLIARDEDSRYYAARVSDLSVPILNTRTRVRPVTKAPRITDIGGVRVFFGFDDPIPITTGSNGDIYVHAVTGEMSEKRGGIWQKVTGLSGADGSLWLSGASAPAATLGEDGNYYFEKSGPAWWKKENGTWVEIVRLDSKGSVAFRKGRSRSFFRRSRIFLL